MTKRAETYEEHSRKRDRTSARKSAKNKLKLAQEGSVPKTQQKSLTGEVIEDE